MSKLTHLDSKGNAKMVDVTEKQSTNRVATASGRVRMAGETLALIAGGGNKKGDVIAIARIAGIQAAKNCSQLIPLCHPLMLTSVKVELELDTRRSSVLISATCKVNGQTGVEMEALSAVSITALTIYDMTKAVDKAMQIGGIQVVLKDGGKSGRYEVS